MLVSDKHGLFVYIYFKKQKEPFRIFFKGLLQALTVKSVFLRMLWNSDVGMDLKLSQTPLKLSPQRFRWAVLSAFA